MLLKITCVVGIVALWYFHPPLNSMLKYVEENCMESDAAFECRLNVLYSLLMILINTKQLPFHYLLCL